MTIFDLVFILCFFATVMALSTAAFLAIRGQQGRSLRMLRWLGFGIAMYAGVLLLTSAFSPQDYAAIGDRQCGDDWCLAVTGARVARHGATAEVEVEFRIESRATRIDQREHAVTVFLRDSAGNRFEPIADSADVPFDTLIHPGQTIATHRRFVVPDRIRIEGITIARKGIPECCIIGHEGSLLHRQTIVRLQ